MAKAMNRIGPSLAVVAVAGLSLAATGCDLLPAAHAPPPPPPQAEAPVALPQRLPPPPPRKPTPPVAMAVPAETVAPLPPSDTPPTPPTDPAQGFDRIIGLDQAHLAAMLGEPRTRAESPPATIWRYSAEGCDLDVYFYLDLQSQAMRALHYEVRSHESFDRPPQRCYDELVSERRAHAESSTGTDRSR